MVYLDRSGYRSKTAKMEWSRFMCAAIFSVFLSSFYSLTEGYTADVKYSWSRPQADDSNELEGFDGLLPFGEPHEPAGSEADVQVNNIVPFAHYRSRRQAPSSTANSTSTFLDDHDYYTSRFHPPGQDADRLWVNLTAKAGITEDLAHNISDRYRFFAVHDLQFEFPFYGHIVDRVAITTAGFIHVGPFLHQSIHLTEYIAPLQADFNPSLNETATVLVYSTGDQFTIQWDKVHNHDHVENGTFTFQLSLFKNGDIHFVYREIPLLLSEMSTENHPVEVGLTDSFYIDQFMIGSGGPFIQRTIYQYHKISLEASDNLAYSAYVISALPNCIAASSCEECVSVSNATPFDCSWCDTLSRCSDGIDRHRQEWFTSRCVLTSTQQCEVPTTTTTAEPTTASPTTTSASPVSTTTATSPAVSPGTLEQTGLSTGTIAGVVVILVLVFLLLFVITGVAIAALVHGYRNPSSKFGQLMIKYRPQARTLNKVDASYNAESGKARFI